MERKAPSPKPWSLLAYTVADDKGGGDALDAPVKHELKAMCDAVDLHAFSIATQVDFKFTPGVFRAVLSVIEREFGKIDPDTQPLWRDIKKRLRGSDVEVEKETVDLNAARGNVLADFLRFGAEKCPAERHVFFMYGHASGPMGLFYDRDSSKHIPNTMRLNDLSDAMQTIKGVVLAVFRDCFMSNLEAAFQLGDVTEFMIASQSVVPISGIWPWKTILPALAKGEATESAAIKVAETLGAFLDDQQNRGPFADAPLSLLDTRAARLIQAPLKALADALDAARTDPARVSECARAIDEARVGRPDTPSHPGDPGLLDVLTMCDALMRLGSDPVVGPARALADVVRNQVVRWFHAQEHSFTGVSLYCKPVTKKDIAASIMQAVDEDEAEKDAAAYRKLALCQATGWDRIALNPLIAAKR